MEKLPDLSHLSKPELISIIELLFAEVNELKERVKILEGKLAKNSRNSSKPPSSDGFLKPKPKPKSLRKRSGKKSGGQKGHKGHNLNRVEHPDHSVIHSLTSCDDCGHGLESVASKRVDKRQVFDIPQLTLDVTEHCAEVKECPQCGQESRANFPEGIGAVTQYGPRVKALSVYMNHYQFVPIDRLGDFYEDVFGHRISNGAVMKASSVCYEALEEYEDLVKSKLIESPVVHFDETGHYVDKNRQWLHSSSTETLTYYASHPKRGHEAMDEIGILPQFKGRAIHDHWKSYYHYIDCEHGLCNAHHFRDLTFLEEQHLQKWAKNMKAFLGEIHETVENRKQKGGKKLAPKTIKKIEIRFKKIITRNLNLLPEPERTGKRGKPKKGVIRNLLERFRDYQYEVLAFMYDFRVPFTNNLAEQDIRMTKVQQKISGAFRTQKGADIFCRVRGYISTARKNSINVMEAIIAAVNGNPFCPDV